MGTAPTPAPATSGMSDNVAGLVAYITFIPAVIFLLVAPYNTNKFVRFHSLQSIGLAVASVIASGIFVVPVLGWITGALLHLAIFVAWIVCLVKASQGQKFKLPVIGDFAEKNA